MQAIIDADMQADMDEGSGREAEAARQAGSGRDNEAGWQTACRQTSSQVDS
jgi:hypothetical protein